MSRTVSVRVSAGNSWYLQIRITGGGFNKETIYKEGQGIGKPVRIV